MGGSINIKVRRLTAGIVALRRFTGPKQGFWNCPHDFPGNPKRFGANGRWVRDVAPHAGFKIARWPDCPSSDCSGVIRVSRPPV
jgi:hypothetical protein